MKLVKHILFLVFILNAGIALGQVKFEAKVSKKKLGINERFNDTPKDAGKPNLFRRQKLPFFVFFLDIFLTPQGHYWTFILIFMAKKISISN